MTRSLSRRSFVVGMVLDVRSADQLDGAFDVMVQKRRVEQSDLLLPRVEIASNQDHESALRWCDVVVPGSAEATSDVWLFS